MFSRDVSLDFVKRLLTPILVEKGKISNGSCCEDFSTRCSQRPESRTTAYPPAGSTCLRANLCPVEWNKSLYLKRGWTKLAITTPFLPPSVLTRLASNSQSPWLSIPSIGIRGVGYHIGLINHVLPLRFQGYETAFSKSQLQLAAQIILVSTGFVVCAVVAKWQFMAINFCCTNIHKLIPSAIVSQRERKCLEENYSFLLL